MSKNIPKNLLPVLKSHQWGEVVRFNGVITDILFIENGKPEKSPVIAYGFDQCKAHAYLQKDSFPEIPIDDFKQQALANLRSKLAGLNWQVLDFSDQLPGLKALAFSGHFNAAECLLLKERMNEAHGKLKVERLLACTPCRGLLLILPFDDENPDALNVFLSVCYENLYATDSESISDIVWILIDGDIKGYLEVNDTYKDHQFERNQEKIKQPTADKYEQGSLDVTNRMGPNRKLESVTLYTPMQIALATFFGTILAGLVTLGINYKILGYVNHIKNTVVAAVVAVPATVAIFAVIPDTRFDRFFPAVMALAMFYISRILQGQQIDTYFQKGCKRKSFWKVAVVSLLSLVTLFVVFFLGIQLFDFDLKRTHM